MISQSSPDGQPEKVAEPSHGDAGALKAYLREFGIHPYGSEELRLYETRLSRFFTREYQRLKEKPVRLGDLGISTREGPMWEETDELMEQHYDERIELFLNFLDSRFMAYTMAYYGATAEQVLVSSISLEQAQQAKFELICGRARVRGDERILNIGMGFGSFESYLLEKYPGVHIVGVTPSQVQADYVRRRMQDPDDPFASGRFTLMMQGFDQAMVGQLGAESFDLVCSIGVFEQLKNMQAAFACIAALLKPGGRTFHHFITSQVTIPQFLDARATLIGSYFPGGRIWPFGELARHIDHLDLVDSWFVNGLNYWRTLDEWHRRFWDNIDRLYGAVLDEAGVKHWNEYFTLCKVLFPPMDGRVYGNGQYLFQKAP